MARMKRKAPSMAVEIYALSDPRTAEIRYIGKANDAKKRLKSHLRDARHRDTPVYRWIRKLAGDGLSPSLTVLASVETDWQRMEVGFIAEGRSMGLRLLNVADGGNEPYCPVETRRANGPKAWAATSHTVMKVHRQFGGLISGYMRSNENGRFNNAINKMNAAREMLIRSYLVAKTSGTLPALEARLRETFLKNDAA
jgi:hypothetical protein